MTATPASPARRRTRLWAATALTALAAWPAHADTFSLGTVSGPATFNYSIIEHTAPFEDLFSFSVASGTSLVFSAFLNTPFSNRFWIDDLDGRLEREGATIAQGDSQVVTLPPFPRTEVTFASQTLGAGDYIVRMSGTPFSVFSPGTYGSYDARLSFAGLAAPVPEPSAWLLMALGVAGIAGSARRRRH